MGFTVLSSVVPNFHVAYQTAGVQNFVRKIPFNCLLIEKKKKKKATKFSKVLFKFVNFARKKWLAGCLLISYPFPGLASLPVLKLNIPKHFWT